MLLTGIYGSNPLKSEASRQQLISVGIGYFTSLMPAAQSGEATKADYESTQDLNTNEYSKL